MRQVLRREEQPEQSMRHTGVGVRKSPCRHAQRKRRRTGYALTRTATGGVALMESTYSVYRDEEKDYSLQVCRFWGPAEVYLM